MIADFLNKIIEDIKNSRSEMRRIDKLTADYYNKLTKLDRSDIRSDRIQIEINRLRTSYNYRQNIILSYKLSLLIILVSILFIITIVSFFVKSKIVLNVTISPVIVLVVISAAASFGIIIIRHLLTIEDRKAKREKDIAEARYLESLNKRTKTRI